LSCEKSVANGEKYLIIVTRCNTKIQKPCHNSNNKSIRVIARSCNLIQLETGNLSCAFFQSLLDIR
jgi:hypothetical protein